MNLRYLIYAERLFKSSRAIGSIIECPANTDTKDYAKAYKSIERHLSDRDDVFSDMLSMSTHSMEYHANLPAFEVGLSMQGVYYNLVVPNLCRREYIEAAKTSLKHKYDVVGIDIIKVTFVDNWEPPRPFVRVINPKTLLFPKNDQLFNPLQL